MLRSIFLLLFCGIQIFQGFGQVDSLSVDLRGYVKERSHDRFKMVSRPDVWHMDQTAIIICDMWDKHWCESATARVAELAPVMNEVVKIARSQGAMIIHAPSDVVDYYEKHPARKRALEAPQASNMPDEIQSWCEWISPEEEEVYPIDQTDGGCDCGDCESYIAWEKQIESIEIFEEDAISASGAEIWNLLEAEGIENVILMGVHTNMCVLGRPFGLRNLTRCGKNVVLMRDLTDTMYNPDSWPYVNHFTGTDLIIEHIEKYICPTISSTVFTGTPAFRFQDDQRPRVLLIHAEDEYRAEETLPAWGQELLVKYNVAVDYAVGKSDADGIERHHIAGIGELSNSDLAVMYIRRRALPGSQMDHIRLYFTQGKPLLALRTSSHAFDVRGNKPEAYEEWATFDPEVLGGNYHGHFGHDAPESVISIVPGMEAHPVLLPSIEGYKSPAWLYKTGPLSPDAQVLLTGSSVGKPEQAIMWTRRYDDSQVLYTSLGHWKDFDQEIFREMLSRSVYWLLVETMPIPNEAGLVKSKREK